MRVIWSFLQSMPPMSQSPIPLKHTMNYYLSFYFHQSTDIEN